MVNEILQMILKMSEKDRNKDSSDYLSITIIFQNSLTALCEDSRAWVVPRDNSKFLNAGMRSKQKSRS